MNSPSPELIALSTRLVELSDAGELTREQWLRAFRRAKELQPDPVILHAFYECAQRPWLQELAAAGEL